MAIVEHSLKDLELKGGVSLDDRLVKGQSQLQVQRCVSLIQATFSAVGLLVKADRSLLSLVQRIEFIGAVLDSSQGRAFLLNLRLQLVQSVVTDMKSHPVTTAQN